MADLIEKFLDKRLITARETRRTYAIHIRGYFRVVNKDIDAYFNNKVTPEAVEDDLAKAYRHYTKKNRPLLSQRSTFNAVKLFLGCYRKELRDLDFWALFSQRCRGAEPKTDKACINRQDIRNVLQHGGTLHRAFFLLMASSGRRDGEILALEPEDVHTDASPAWMSIKKTITNDARTKTGQKTEKAYISDEAAHAYDLWMKERDDHMRNAAKKNYKPKPDDTRCFPFNLTTINMMWTNMLMKSGVVKYEYKVSPCGKKRKVAKRKDKGERLSMTPYCLRSFYRSYLGDGDLSEYLLGHSTALTRAYKKMKPEDIAARYQALMPNVTIFETPTDLSGINESLKQKDKDIEEMKAQIAELRLALLEEKVNNGTKKNNLAMR